MNICAVTGRRGTTPGGPKRRRVLIYVFCGSLALTVFACAAVLTAFSPWTHTARPAAGAGASGAAAVTASASRASGPPSLRPSVSADSAVATPSSPPTRPPCDNTRPVLNVAVPAAGNIQAAIDKVAAAGGGCVDLGAGTWTLGASLRMKNRVTLNGRGASTLLQGPGSVYGFALITGDGTEPLVDMTVENLVLDGRIPPSALTTEPNASNPYGGALGIFFAAYTTDDRNILIKNVEVRHTAMGIHVKGTTGLTLDGVDIHHNGIAYWLHNVYLRRCSDVTIVHSRMDDSLIGTGLHIAGGGQNIAISQSDFSGNSGSGMNIQDLPTNVTIQDSQMIGDKGDGISAVGTNLIITGVKAQGNTGDGIHTWGGTGRVEGNTATANQSANLSIHGQFTSSGNTT